MKQLIMAITLIISVSVKAGTDVPRSVDELCKMTIENLGEAMKNNSQFEFIPLAEDKKFREGDSNFYLYALDFSVEALQKEISELNNFIVENNENAMTSFNAIQNLTEAQRTAVLKNDESNINPENRHLAELLAKSIENNYNNTALREEDVKYLEVAIEEQIKSTFSKVQSYCRSLDAELL